jgi:hypothetical protein
MDNIFKRLILELLHKKLYANLDNVDVRAHFEISIYMMTDVSLHIQLTGEVVLTMDILIALHFIRVFETEPVLTAFFSLSGKTYRRRRNLSLRTMCHALPEVY